ncbi:uncharacterized protein LOC6504665 [Drosophila ananassae]|uniref:uncharacterized protein LOC6504665 n=1 Tax=Drosophila ananassae TaxID=7217 RepID=UPI0013A5E600|nr:uncharacterized protein LOC6504665 [Drosophila ananassae]
MFASWQTSWSPTTSKFRKFDSLSFRSTRASSLGDPLVEQVVMLVTTMLPRYVPEGVPPLPLTDWTRRSPSCDEESLLLVLALSILTQLLLVVYLGFAFFQPCSLRRRQLNECQRRRYASFIFRRLLWHLDDALGLGSRVENIPAGERLEHCLRVSEQVAKAIQIFRRDALKVLHPCQDLSSHSAGDLYFVLEEEERDLTHAGYGLPQQDTQPDSFSVCGSADTGTETIEVTEELLMSLLYPERSVVVVTE